MAYVAKTLSSLEEVPTWWGDGVVLCLLPFGDVSLCPCSHTDLPYSPAVPEWPL